MADIADECGVSERTVRRELDTNKALQKFVRAQREYDPDGHRGGYRNGAKSFQVSMDDPLHPLDEQELVKVMRRKAGEAEKRQETPLERARRLAAPGQFDRAQKAGPVKLTGHRDNLSKTSDKLTALPGQIDRALKSLDSSLLKITSEDAASPPEVFASLSQSQKEPEASGDVSLAVLTRYPGPSPKGTPEQQRAYWEAADSLFARDWCRKKGWTWRGGTDGG